MANNDKLSWLNLFLIIIIVIILIIIVVIYNAHRNELNNLGIRYTIQYGTINNTTDIMVADGSKIYIGQSSRPLILTLNRSNNHQVGRLIMIKNNSPNNIILKAGTIKLDFGQLNNTIEIGKTANLLSIDNNDRWLRLQ